MEHPKVCILAGLLPHDDTRMTGREARSLRERGCEVTILCTDFEGTDADGIRYQRITAPRGPWSQARYIAKFWKAARATGADFYHFYDPAFLPGAARYRRIGKMIYDLGAPLALPGLDGSREPLPSDRKGEQHLRRLYAIVMADQQQWEATKRLNRRRMLIQNYPTAQELDAIRVERAGARRNKFCCIGELSERQGLLALLRAVEEEDVSLLLAGDFPSEEERAAAEAEAGWKQAKYIGRPKTEGLRALFSVVCAGILLPQANGGEEPPPDDLLYQYMAAEVPVIVSNFSAWSELVEDARCGICVDPQKPEEIRTAIEYLRKSPDIAGGMGQNGRHCVQSKYNWDREKEKLFGLYRLPIE